MRQRLGAIICAFALTVAPGIWLPGDLGAGVASAAATNSWISAAAVSEVTTNPRVVTLLDGRVLMVSGGYDGVPYNGAISIPRIYDPSAGTWSPTATPPWTGTAVGQFATRLADGRVLIGGGSVEDEHTTYTSRDAFIYDPTQPSGGTWTPVAPMPTGLTTAGAALMQDGRAIAVNGDRAYAYSPGTNSWTQLANLPYPVVNQLVLALNNNKVLSLGGMNPYDNSASQGFYIYDVATNVWTLGPVTAGGFGRAAVVLADGRVLIAGGGGSSGPSAHGILYDPVTNTYKTVPDMHSQRMGPALVRMANGLVLAAGGRASTGMTKSAEVYDAFTNAWYTAASMSDFHEGAGSALLPNGTVLVAGGNVLTSEIYTPGDIVPPAMGTPLASLRSGTTLGSTLPARLTWSANDGGGSGLGTFDVARSTNGGAYTTIASAITSPSLNVSLTVGNTYKFRVRGRDKAGHTSAWAIGPTLTPGLSQQTSTAITYYKTWTTGSSSSYSGGSVRYASTAASSASYTFTGRSIAFVSRRTTGRGVATIYIDGLIVATVDLYSATSTYKYVAWSKTWTSSAKHTLKIVVAGTAGRPRVDLDALEVIR